MKRKIKVTAKQYATISKIYRFGGFAIITGLLASISVLVGKPFEFLFIFLPYFISKNFYEKQYHAKSLKQCFVMSLMIFAAAIIFVFPAEISMTSSVIIGSGIAYISYKAGTIQYKLRDYDNDKDCIPFVGVQSFLCVIQSKCEGGKICAPPHVRISIPRSYNQTIIGVKKCTTINTDNTDNMAAICRHKRLTAALCLNRAVILQRHLSCLRRQITPLRRNRCRQPHSKGK